MKRVLLFALAAVAFHTSAHGDEIVLKDGKRLLWRTITDNGDSYEIESSLGQRLTIKKSDVVGFEKTSPQSPLSGASFTLDKKAVNVDILSGADLKGRGVTGEWRRQGGALVCSAEASTHAKLPLPFTPLPDEYDLTIVAERKDRCNGLIIGIVAGGNQCTVHFDSIEGAMCGLMFIDGKTFYDGEGNGTQVPGPRFKNNAPRTIKLMIRKEAFVAKIDGKDVIIWKADWKRVSNQPALAIPQKNLLYLCIYDSTWKILSVVLSYVK